MPLKRKTAPRNPSSFGSVDKERIKEELVKCARNPIYFIDNYCKVQHKKRGLVDFKLYPFQKEVLEIFRKNEYVITNKSRQVGMSTLMSGYICWFMLFQEDRQVLIMANKEKTAIEMLDKVKLMYQMLPEWLRSISEIDSDNAKTLKLKNRSKITATATTRDAGRGLAISLLVVDECAMIENMDDIWTSIWPTLSSGKNGEERHNGIRCLLLSTPLGTGNFFHRMFTEAETGKNKFKAVTLPWHLVPEYDDEWFAEQTATLGDSRKIAQEYECSFVGSGYTVIDSTDIEYLKKFSKDPIMKAGMDLGLWIWEEFVPGHKYILACDVAKGAGADYSTIIVLDCSKATVVAEYQSKIPTDRFSVTVLNTAKVYGNALVIVEENGPGWSVLDRLVEEGYEHIFYKKKTSSFPNEMVDSSYAKYDDSCSKGFAISSRTRELTISKLEEVIRNKQITFLSKRFATELETFIYKNGRPEAMSGYNDDLCLAASILSWVYIAHFQHYYGKDIGDSFAREIPLPMKSSKQIGITVAGQLPVEPMEEKASSIYRGIKYGGMPMIRIG